MTNLPKFFLVYKMFQINVVQKNKTHFTYSNFFFWKSVSKDVEPEGAGGKNMAHARCVLDK
jgi:hypothetical protein